MSTERRSILQESLAAIERLQAKLAASERALRQPIAIVGAGCRYPGGVDSPEALWHLVRDGVDAVREVPRDRWDVDAYYDPDPAAPGKMITRRGGFLSQVDRFDAQFFGISPREATMLDPQQRLLLEVTQEALENAALPTDRLTGSRTGVFVGITMSDYGQLLRAGGLTHADVYAATGSTLNAAAGRISFTYGFHGPCIALDTACSSSLVVVHMACQSLRTGESNLALAGGVNVILSPDAMVLFSRWGMLAPDGACKTFDAAADGFVRAEGCAVVALKRLSDALAAGDPILAVIRGSAVNSDGHSSGLTVPNGLAQQALLRTALSSAGLEPADIDYVEAHGTGTSLGDPIEVEALGAVMGADRDPQRPLLIGSLKTNIGHAESAAGLAGLLKVVMALRHEAIPPHLHFSQPNPSIPWSDVAVKVPTTLTPWSRGTRVRRAGVSSFGVSGTNAHVLLEEAPVIAAPARTSARPADLVTLSGKTAGAVRDLAAAYAGFIREKPGMTLADLGHTTALGRASLAHRAAFAAGSVEDAVRMLEEIAATDVSVSAGGPGVASSRSVVSRRVAAGIRPQVAFMFPGQGAQWAGMTRELAANEPVVRDALQECSEILAKELDVPLLELLGRADLLDQTKYTQPAMFAVEWALAQLWRSLGVEPAAVIGHSVGEYAAACLAGVMDLKDGLRLIAARARLMQERSVPGAMAAVLADEQSVSSQLLRQGGSLVIAAVNGPESVVVSGAVDELLAFQEQLTAGGVRSQRLAVTRAFHSPLLDPMLSAFREVAATIAFRKPTVPLYSNLTGSQAGAEIATPEYWVRHAREPVRFSAGIAALLAGKTQVLLEVGPGTVLVGLGQSCNRAESLQWIATLRKDRGEDLALAEAVGQLWTCGVPVNMAAYRENRGGRTLSLPTYPFQRERYWVEVAANVPVAPQVSLAAPSVSADSEWQYEIQWQPSPRASAPLQDAGSTSTAQHWLILSDRGGVGDSLIERLNARGERCTRQPYDQGVDFKRLLELRPTRVVHLWSLDEDSDRPLTGESLLAAQQRNCGSLLEVVQSLAADGLPEPAQLTVVTRGAAVTGAGECAIAASSGAGKGALAAAPVAALARVVALELPQLNCVSIDLDPVQPDVESLCTELVSRDRETAVAIRGGGRLAARLVHSADRPSGTSHAPITPDATYLVTGGLGGLGIEVARSLVTRGARHLVLLGRNAPSERARTAIAAMTSLGASLRIEAVDVADRTALERLFESIARTMPPLSGIVHAAGVLDDGVLVQQTWERFERVFSPKLQGAWNLHELSAPLPLKFFVLFSSAAALLGSPGQGNYTAANAFLDALAHYRRERRLPGVSIAWGAWGEAGMAALRDSRQQDRASRHGIAVMGSEAALAMLHDLSTGPVAHVGVMNVDWSKFLAQYPAGQTPPLLDLLVPRLPQPAAGQLPLADRLSRAPAGGEDEVLISYVRECLGSVLGMHPDKIDVDVPLLQMGLDSLMAIEMRNRVERSGGPVLPLARYLDGSDVLGIARAIRTTLPEQPAELRRIARTDAMELSFGQERIWTLEQVRPDSHNNALLRFGLQGRLDREALLRSLDAIVERHEVLRATFRVVDGRPVQRISPPSHLEVRDLDLSGLARPARIAAERRAAVAEANTQLDLASGPLLKCLLIRLSAEDHVLVVTIHHIVSDGWSADLLCKELATLYAGSASGKPVALPDLPIQYVDFAHWQRRWLTGATLDSRREYWKKKLAGPLPALDLPFDRPPAASRSYEGATHRFRLGATQLTGLRELSRREGVTLYTLLLTALNTLLHRYSGQDDVVVGTFVAGRSRIEVERLMGFFVNTLVLRADFSGDPTFRTALRRARDMVLEGQANADFPFDALVAELRPERDLNRSPFFDVVFNMQSYEYDAGLARAGLHISALPSLEYFMVTDTLTFFAFDHHSELEIAIVYSPELFDADTIARLESHFTTLLAGVLADPDRVVSGLPLMSDTECRRLVELGRGPRASFPTDRSYAQHFEAQVQQTPDALAVVDDDCRLTYAELNSRANRIAHLLIARGVQPGEPVAMCSERSATLLSWILGALKAGAAYLPLDSRYPPGRHGDMLRQARSRVVLSSDALAAHLAEAVRDVPSELRPDILTATALDASSAGGAAASDPGDPTGPSDPDGLAYIIFTSGSTGTPKGAMVPQRAMMNHFLAKTRALGLGPNECVAQIAPIGFDISVWQFLAVLLAGGCVRVVPEAAVLEPERLFELIRRENVTIAQVVPSFLRAFLDGYHGREGSAGEFERLRSLLLVGEALPPDLARRWLELWPRVPLVNGYGPSECADEATRQVLTAPPSELDATVPIGRPIDNVSVHIVDRAGGLLPPGVGGELCIGGAGVGLGYLHDLERTAAAFVPAPLGEPGLMYRTGDRARMRPDGVVEFLGRLDFQVKIRGHRIELGEIEAVLERHPGVRQAVAQPWQSQAGARLVAYIVPRESQSPPSPEDLRVHLATVLPPYMIPEDVVVLAQLPLNANGKVNRRALSAPADTTRREFHAPRTPMEIAVASVWSALLKQARIGVRDNFFEIGGHSLLAAQAVARLRVELEVEVGVRALFERQTLADFARYLEVEQERAAEAREELLL